MIIDFHTHAFPDPLAHHAIERLVELGDIPAYTNGTVTDLKRSMKEAGITHSVVCNIVVKEGQFEKVHEFAKSLLPDRSTGNYPCVIPLSSVHPLDPNWKAQLQTVKDDGFVGIKLHPDYQGVAINDYRMESFFKEAFRLGLLIIFHAGWDAGFPDTKNAYPKKVADIMPVLEQGTTILAHLGGNMRPEEVIEYLCGHNVYFDTAYSLEKIPLELAREVIRKHSPDKMLFGSDVPWANQKLYVDYFRNEISDGFLSKEDQHKIEWSNSAKLLGIES